MTLERSLGQQAESLRSEQRACWQKGDRVAAETYLAQHSWLRADEEGALEVIYNEALLREELGETPELEEYIQRFPQFSHRLRLLFEVHRHLGPGDLLDDTALKTLPDEAATNSKSAAGLPTVAGYKIVRELGSGGMGIVYLAWQTGLKRPAALKMIRAGGFASSREQARFRTEAEAVGRLQHPHIVQIYEVGEANGLPYLSIEYVGGGSLAQQLAGKPFPYRTAARWVEILARAMSYAHQRGIIHRDLKPANILLAVTGDQESVTGGPSPGTEKPDLGSRITDHYSPKITDFGLAKFLVEAGAVETQSGAVVGTPSYMAPEQACGKTKELGPAVDVYSLGAILYEMLTGRPPFVGESPVETLLQVRTLEPITPSRLQPHLPPDLTTICLKCLEKDSGKRYPSAEDLAEDLRRFLAGEPIRARPVGNTEKLWRWCRRKPLVAGLTAIVALLFLVLAVGSFVASLSLREQLWESKLAEARAHRRSDEVGRRRKALDALTVAARIRVTPELRNEVIASLALFDLDVVKEWAGRPANTFHIDFDGALELYARTDRQGTVSICRVEDDVELHRLVDFGSGESWPLFSRNGRFLAVYASGQLKVWNLAGAEPVSVVKVGGVVFTDRVSSPVIDFSADSRQLAVGLWKDGALQVHVYELARQAVPCQQPPRPLKLGGEVLGGELRHLAFHPTKPQLAVAGAHGVQIFDLESGKAVADLRQEAGAYWLAWHPEGQTLAVVDHDSQICLWDMATRTQTWVLQGHGNAGIRATFNHAGDLLASNGWEGALRLWDPRTGRQLFSTPAWTFGLRFSLDDRRLAAEINGNQLRIWEVTASREYRTLVRDPIWTKATPYSIAAVHPNGRLLAVSMWDGGVGFWDLRTGTPLDFIRLGSTAGLLFEPSGALLTNGLAGLQRWPIEEQAQGAVRIGPPRRLPLPGSINHIACSRDGRVLASSQGNVTLVLHLDRPEQPPIRLEPHPDVRFIAVSPDGQFVATGSHNDLHVKVWEAQTRKMVKLLEVGSAVGVNFSPNGKWLATNSSEGGCRLWAVPSWQEGPRFGGPPLVGFAFSPDSKLLAVETGHGVIRLLEPDTGREWARLEDPNRHRASRITFSPDGTQLVAVSGDGGEALHIWDLRAIGQHLTELGLSWDLPLDLPANPNAIPGALRIQIELSAELRAAHHTRLNQFDKAIADYQEALARDPKEALLCNNLAWIYVTGPHELRDAAKALPLALKAVESNRSHSLYLNTLGVVYYRLNQVDKAVATLQDADRADTEQSYRAWNLYFLAMSFHQLNKPADAQKAYLEAIRWQMQKWQTQAQMSPGDIEELNAFRAEAEALLKIPSKP